tara:strand:+ start:572 stop:835 length:264 start_codon:yes stop_codon:yes gene_type:complete
METVTEKQVLEENELTQLKELQDKTKALVFELGEIEMIKIQLDVRRNQAEEFLLKTSLEEQELTEKLIEKYGKSSVNPETGEVTKLD